MGFSSGLNSGQFLACSYTPSDNSQHASRRQASSRDHDFAGVSLRTAWAIECLLDDRLVPPPHRLADGTGASSSSAKKIGGQRTWPHALPLRETCAEALW